MKKFIYQFLNYKPLLTTLLVILVGLTVNQGTLAQEFAIDFGRTNPEVVVAEDGLQQLGLNFSYNGLNAFAS